MLSKCSRCGGALYSRRGYGYANCLNCGYEPPQLSKEVEDEVTKSIGAKRVGGWRTNKTGHHSGY